MSTYCHVGQSICPLRISMGTLERHYVAPSIHHPTTSQAFNNMRTVSGYILLHTASVSLYLLSTQYLSRHSTSYSELKRSRRDFRYN